MKKIMIFIEGTTFYTKSFLFLFSKKGYVLIGNSIKIINDLYSNGNIYKLSDKICYIWRLFKIYK